MRKRRLLPSLALVLMLAAAGEAADLPTASFRGEHAVVKEHLAHLDTMAGTLAAKGPADQKKAARFIASFLKDHILEHAAWEERHLYPAVDRRTHKGQHPFTATMRYEHQIIGRSIRNLAAAAELDAFDAVRFARDTDRLLGLIAAHFEEEEEVLLPVLDKSMTKDEVEKELGESKGKH